MAFAFFFPGQGSQSLHMLDSFADIQVVRDTFAEASEVLQQDLWEMLQGNDAKEINSTLNTQPIMLAADVAIWRAWQEKTKVQPSFLAGHSLGEYAALVASDALGFADGLRLVRLRAKTMQDATPEGYGCMAAILGLNEATVSDICLQSAQNSIVETANLNSPEQIVIAGESAAVARAIEACKASGAKRALLLPVSVPSHCALMKNASKQLAVALSTINLYPPKIPVVQNADVQSYTNPEKIKDALVRQLYKPVRWTDTVEYIAQQNISLIAECGPGKVLTGLAKRINNSLRCFALNNPSALETILSEFS